MDFSWLKLEAFSIDELIALERLIMLEHCRRNAQVSESEAELPPVSASAEPPTHPALASSPVQEIEPSNQPRQ